MTSRVAELAARASYGRLVALLATETRDLAAAEDALSDAFVAALERWPRDGVPDNPDAWLFTAARRRIIDGHRRARVRTREARQVADVLEDLAAAHGDAALPDHRLRLLFVCTHPAIDPQAQIPLMLQTVLGLDASAIASAMRVAPKTMGQRLWRAKTKIREAGIPFETPEPDERPARLDAVLEAIYAAFGTAWEDVSGRDVRLRDLAEEAIFLGRLLVELAPDAPECLGLLALMLFAHARRGARRDAEGRYVPLEAQDQTRWSQAAIDEAEALLQRAFQLAVHPPRGAEAAEKSAPFGPFQIEAAIQSAHVSGARLGRTDHAAIATLYDALVARAPSLGARVGQAAACIEGRSPAAALEALDAIEPQLAADYQPYWAVRAAALSAAGALELAASAYSRAIGLTEDQATRDFLKRRLDALTER